jgi:hypothetical protein
MAQMRQVAGAVPHVALYFAAALVVAIVVTAMVTTNTLNLFGAQAPAVQRLQLDPGVVQSGAEWERQRLAQSLQFDPVRQAGADWESQRRQQSGYVDPLTISGQEWESQRRQQSGGSE